MSTSRGVSLAKISDQTWVEQDVAPANVIPRQYPGHRAGLAANDLVSFASLLFCNMLADHIGMTWQGRTYPPKHTGCGCN